MPTDASVSTLLFEEEEIIAHPGDLGECILDNWGIEAIVYNPKSVDRAGAFLGDAVRKLSKEYGIPWITAEEAFGKKL